MGSLGFLGVQVFWGLLFLGFLGLRLSGLLGSGFTGFRVKGLLGLWGAGLRALLGFWVRVYWVCKVQGLEFTSWVQGSGCIGFTVLRAHGFRV